MGGEGFINDKENGLGRYTAGPTVSLRMHPDLIKALQAAAIAEASAKAIKKYRDDAGLDPEAAANMDAGNRGIPHPVQIIRAPQGLYLVNDVGGGQGRRH